MSAALGYTLFALIGTLGAAFLFKGRAVRDWIIRFYKNDRITRHLAMPGWLLSMRLVGLGWLIFGLVVIVAGIRTSISN
jgi:hypothetical protein